MKSRTIVLSVIAAPVLVFIGFYLYLCYFWKPDILPLRQLGDVVITRVSTGLAAFETATVIVVYDNHGSISLRGPAAKNPGQKYSNIADLRSALIALHSKGPAFIMEMNSSPSNTTGQSSPQTLLSPTSPAPAINFELESQIRDALIAAGFTPLNNPPPTYNLHRIPAPAN
jgi:hypothetical protein